MNTSFGALFAATLLVVAPLPSSASDGGQMILYSDNQRTTAMQNFPEPLALNILDGGGRPVPNVIITMTVESGTATFLYIAHGTVSGDGRVASTSTDVNGTAIAILTAGAMVGQVVLSVVASPDPQLSATFVPITKSMTMMIDPPGLPLGRMPDTGGGTTPWLSGVAATLLAAGMGLLGLRRWTKNELG